MNVRQTPLPGVVVLEPKVFRDDRGFFTETFNTRALEGSGIPERFVQDNHSRSTRGVLRGLHYQLQSPQGKLVRAARGNIFDVAVDIRTGSPHFGEWFGIELSDENLFSLWVPPGFAHGFAVLSDVADVTYKCTTLYDAADDRGLPWNDPRFGIEWPISDPILSAKDSQHQPLSSMRTDLPRFE